MLFGSWIKNSDNVASVYKIYVMSDNDVMFKFSAAAGRLALGVLLFARKEVRSTPFASHALVKGLVGKELVVKHNSSLLALFLSSFVLNAPGNR